MWCRCCYKFSNSGNVFWFVFPLLVLIIREMGWKVEKRKKSWFLGLVFFFPAPSFLTFSPWPATFEFRLPVFSDCWYEHEHFRTLHDSFSCCLALGALYVSVNKEIFLKLQGPNFGWDQSIKIWCLDYIQSKIFSLNNYVFNAFLKLKVLHEQFLCTFLRRGFCFSVICLNESTNNWIENSVVSSV